jgi:hypothetical protein
MRTTSMPPPVPNGVGRDLGRGKEHLQRLRGAVPGGGALAGEALAQLLGVFSYVAYIRLVTISTGTHHASQEFRNSVGAPWPFLSDPERIVQKDLDIQEYTDPENDPMIPHTLVLKPGSWSTGSTTATGSGGAPRSSISGTT